MDASVEYAIEAIKVTYLGVPGVHKAHDLSIARFDNGRH
jgi:hypothetical protein